MDEKNELNLKVIEAKGIVINNQDDYEKAVDFLRQLKEFKKKLDERYLPVKKKAYEAYQEAMKMIKDYDNPISEAERKIKSVMSQYVTKKEAERRAEEERIRKEAEEKERAKIQADLQEVGFKKKEAKAEAEKMEVATPEVKLEDKTKTDGISYRINWNYEIVDVSKIPAEYMIPDEKKIGAYVRAMKENAKIAGVRIFSSKSVVNRF